MGIFHWVRKDLIDQSVTYTIIIFFQVFPPCFLSHFSPLQAGRNLMRKPLIDIRLKEKQG